MSKPWIDIEAHRANKNYDSDVLLRRVLYALVRPLLRASPKSFYRFRNFILRLFGAKLASSVRIYPTTSIVFPWNFEAGDFATVAPDVTLYCLGRISLGNNVIISQGAHLCAGTHDYKQSNLPLECPPVTIGDSVWICAEVFVGPGVTVGKNSIIGARSVVVKDVPETSIAVGNPARVLCDRPKPSDC